MLACEGLEFGYRRGRAVLREITGAFAPGRIAVVVGPNGSGKTTLARLMIGALAPTSGRIALDGRAIHTMTAGERAHRVAYVAQRPGAGADFDARRVIAMGRLAIAGARHEHDEAVERAVARLGLGALVGEPFGTLSVGQQQRVALARAMAQLDRATREASEGVLVADEPFSALDPAHALVAARELRHLAAQGTTVVLVIHDLTTAARIGDDALALAGDGRCAAWGAVHDVLTPDAMERVFGVGFRREGEALLAELGHGLEAGRAMGGATNVGPR